MMKINEDEGGSGAGEYLKEHGCKACGKYPEKVFVGYSCPPTYQYTCDCGHKGRVVQINYRFPVINLGEEDYLNARKLSNEKKIPMKEAVEQFGGTIDYGPPPEYSHT